MKILLVEDRPRTCDLLCSQVRAAGHEADEATDLGAAERLLATNRYDAVVADWLLGDERGTDLIRSMREAGDATPAVLMTAAGPGDVAEAAAGLAVPVILKPLEAEDLLGVLEKVVRS